MDKKAAATFEVGGTAFDHGCSISIVFAVTVVGIATIMLINKAVMTFNIMALLCPSY